MKASSWGQLAPWGRDCATQTKGVEDHEKTTTLLPPDDGDLFPLALWNACATNPISFPAADASIMCQHGSPWKRVMAVDAEEEQEEGEGSWSAGEETQGK